MRAYWPSHAIGRICRSLQHALERFVLVRLSGFSEAGSALSQGESVFQAAQTTSSKRQRVNPPAALQNTRWRVVLV